jgi:hypothetical protein
VEERIRIRSNRWIELEDFRMAENERQQSWLARRARVIISWLLESPGGPGPEGLGSTVIHPSQETRR